MAKKTARPAAAKPTQQRSKEEQWRRRMAQQSQTGMTSVVVPPENAGTETAYAGDVAQTSTAAATSMPARTTASSATNARRTASLAAQRATTTAARTRAARLGAQTISIPDEMRFIRADIRKLVIMTAFCIAVLLVLSFVVPMVYK